MTPWAPHAQEEVQQAPAIHISHWYLYNPTLGLGQFAMTGNLLTKLSFQWPYILWSYFPRPIRGKNLMTSSFIHLLVCHWCINVSLFRKSIYIFRKGWRLAMVRASSVEAAGCSTTTIPSTWLPIFTKFELSISHITPSQTMCVKLAYRLKSYWKGWRWIDPQKMSPHEFHLFRTPM